LIKLLYQLHTAAGILFAFHLLFFLLLLPLLFFIYLVFPCFSYSALICSSFIYSYCTYVFLSYRLSLPHKSLSPYLVLLSLDGALLLGN